MTSPQEYMERSDRWEREAAEHDARARDLRARGGQRELAKEYEDRASECRRLARDARELSR